MRSRKFPFLLVLILAFPLIISGCGPDPAGSSDILVIKEGQIAYQEDPLE